MQYLRLIFTFILILGLVTGCANPAATKQTPTEPVQEKAVPVICEVMADNRDLCLGHNLDWVELHNPNSQFLDLKDLYLTDTLEKPDQLSLNGYTLDANGYLVVELPLDAPFHLAAEGETVYLTDGKHALSQLTFGLSKDGCSFDQKGVCQQPTPGFSNTQEGYQSYLSTLTRPALTINEVIASNSKHHPVNGKYYDMVEVKNTSDSPVDLGEYTLSDKRKEPDRYTFPAITLKAGAFFLVYCSGEPTLGNNHTSFKISAANQESLYLAKQGVIVDKLDLPDDLVENESYGRTDNGFAHFSSPTFGKENNQGLQDGVSVPTANLPSGLYAKSQKITLTGKGTIYYTTDGSRPTTASSVYTSPITVNDVTTIRTFCVDSSRKSAIGAYTYIVGKQHDLPVVTVSIAQSKLTGKKKGILNHIEQTYEYECQVTLLEDGSEKFSVPCGFRLHGNGSRECPKQNFQLRFRSKYGVSKLQYKLFDNREFDEYNSLLLKGGSEDWDKAVMRDEVATLAAQENTALYTQAYKPVVLYLGDQYWGIYYLRERFSDDYVASHLNVSESSVDLLFTSGGYIQSGSNKDFSALKDYVTSHDMSQNKHYQYLCDRIDVNSLMDWYICRSFMGDKDLANIRRFRSTEGDGKWRWMYFDLDWAFVVTGDQPLSGIVNDRNGEPILIQALLKNKQGKDAFLKRYAHLLKTTLNESYMNGIIDRIVTDIESEIPRDRARWERSVSGWESQVQRLRDYVSGDGRTKQVLDNLQSFFDLSDKQMKQYFGTLAQ